MSAIILAMDISSTCIGVCYDGSPLETWVLPKLDIASRCYAARVRLQRHLVQYPNVDFIVYERPAGRHKNSIAVQACVQGAILSVIAERGIAYELVSAADAKKVLTGKGNATKEQMIAAASAATGKALDEHQADSYGLWLSALQLRVEKVAA